MTINTISTACHSPHQSNIIKHRLARSSQDGMVQVASYIYTILVKSLHKPFREAGPTSTTYFVAFVGSSILFLFFSGYDKSI